MKIIKRDGSKEIFNFEKIYHAIKSAFDASGVLYDNRVYQRAFDEINDYIKEYGNIDVETVQDLIEDAFYAEDHKSVGKLFSTYRERRAKIRERVDEKEAFINKYSNAYNTADATVDDNSNVASKNIAIMNTEIHKEDNIDINRGMMTRKISHLFPTMPSKYYIKDLENHFVYKHDESSFAGAVAPYCCSISMYPFLLNGIKDIGGLSAAPKNIDSFCGMYVNLIFAVASQFAGAVATPEFLMYFDYFARKEWGETYYEYSNEETTALICSRQLTIRDQIHQYFQQVIYSINQPAAARGMQSAFVNFSYFDKPFFEAMFGDFVFPDGSRPVWESLEWLQWEFMEWFSKERERVVLTFPVESFALIYKDGKFEDEKSARKLAKVMANGHYPFIYISDTVDSLSSCCFDGKTKIGYNDGNEYKEISFEDAYITDGDKTVGVPSINPYTNEYSWRTGKIVKHETSAWREIILENNETIKVTLDHILPIRRNCEIIDCVAGDLLIGDEIMFFNRVNYEINCRGFEFIKIKTITNSRLFSPSNCYCIEMVDKNNPYFILPSHLITHNCRLRNSIQNKEFSFTNGNIGVMTGSKSVMTLNLHRLMNDFVLNHCHSTKSVKETIDQFCEYLRNGILQRVYKYQVAYNSLLDDMKAAKMLPVYDAGFIDLKKQYLTIGINGFNEAAEYLYIKCNLNDDYKYFANKVFSTIKEENQKAGRQYGVMFNTEMVPAESLGIKNYNWDKAAGLKLREDRNLYASYMFVPSDTELNPLQKIELHGREYIGDYLDGGSACHINMDEHLTEEQYYLLMQYAGIKGCSYFTINIPFNVCHDCHKVTRKSHLEKCPHCGGPIDTYDRIIGYLTKTKNWSEGRRIEYKTRSFSKGNPE